MANVSIFQFTDFKQYLKVAWSSYGSRRSRPATFDALASKLGYRSARSVAMVMSGQRLPSAEMVDRLSRHFEFKANEHRYLELLVKLEKCKQKNKDPRPVLSELGRIRPIPTEANIDANAFAYIADWYHFVIKQLLASNSSLSDPRKIARTLRAPLSERDIRTAIQTMLDLGLIQKQENGDLRVTEQSITTTQGIPDQALRKHHKGMIGRALECIEESDFHNRELTSITLRMDPEKMTEAKKAIRQFRDSFHQQFESGDSQHVYQLNFQLFEHTKQRTNLR